MARGRNVVARVKGTPWLRAMGTAFRTLRKKHGLTQSDFPPSSKSTVSDFERGEEAVSMPIFEAWCTIGGFSAFEVCYLAVKEAA